MALTMDQLVEETNKILEECVAHLPDSEKDQARGEILEDFSKSMFHFNSGVQPFNREE